MGVPLYGGTPGGDLGGGAALGFLEPVHVSGIELTSRGWVYRFSTGAADGGQVHGDRRLFATGSVLYLDESELVTYCEALRLATVVARATLSRLLALSSKCPP